MTELEFAACQEALGRRIHESEGVFWERVYPQYCKPAFAFRELDPGEGRPRRRSSLLGYSHLVRTQELANRSLPVMEIDRATLRIGIGLLDLPAKKRNQVRRALSECEVRGLDATSFDLERLREINISQAIRQEAGAGTETPVRRYTEEADAWRRQVAREFECGGREWWGSYVGDVLAAYMRTYQVGRVRVIEQTKADTRLLNHYPMDALYFTVLTRSSQDPTCERIVNGRPQHQSLNRYKEQFLFSASVSGVFASNSSLIASGKAVLGAAEWARSTGSRILGTQKWHDREGRRADEA